MVEEGRFNPDETRVLGRSAADGRSNREILLEVYEALKEKGYDPIRQIAYYLVTGEPVYITAHRNARSLAARLERDEVIEELVAFYLQHHRP
ncbi:MAG: IreB family regulatory phosphoprotein [Firmicutes bacterium]|nr:IreB family regulatory phosphoprotein [Bacillota bacterium]